MSEPYPNALALSRKVLRVLIVLNLVVAGLILVLLAASLSAETWVMQALGAEHPGHDESNSSLVRGMRLIMVIGILAAPITHVVLTRLRDIVETVGHGDPFVMQNAARLETIAWSVLGLEVMHLIVGGIAARVSSEGHPLDLDWNFSLTRWLAVVLLFVLARVFEQGTRMREDLAGTV